MMPQESPAAQIILSAIFENSSLNNRMELIQALQQMNQPSEDEMAARKIDFEKASLENEELKADIAKAYAEVQRINIDSESKATVDQMKKQVDIEEKLAKIDETKAETLRNIPEIEHLRSETELNKANARVAGLNRGRGEWREG